jgi:hypothetical protein
MFLKWGRPIEVVLIFLSSHCQEHPAEIRDEPDQPDKNTETVEFDFH